MFVYVMFECISHLFNKRHLTYLFINFSRHDPDDPTATSTCNAAPSDTCCQHAASDGHSSTTSALHRLASGTCAASSIECCQPTVDASNTSPSDANVRIESGSSTVLGCFTFHVPCLHCLASN